MDADSADGGRMRRALALRFTLLLTLSIPVCAADPAAGAALRLAIVIPDGAEEGATFHTNLGKEFEAGLRQWGSSDARVHAEAVTAREAAARLKARRCDAVIVLGGDRPLALRRVAERTFAANLGRAFSFRPAYLMMRQGDAGDAARAELLGATFAGALRGLAAARATD